MKCKWMALFLFVFSFASLNSMLAQNYAPAVNYPAQVQPLGIAKGDFNEDGKVDLVFTNAGSSSLSLFEGSGDGTFANAISIAVGANPISVVSADFNGDGHLDLALTLGTSQAFQVLLGNGNGTFQSPVSVPIPGLASFSSVGQIVAADFNEDRKQDLAIATDNGVAIFLNNGVAGFTESSNVDQAVVIAGIAVASLMNGHVGLVGVESGSDSAGNTSGNVFFSLGNGNGAFQPVTHVMQFSGSPAGIAVGDVNNDGRADLVVSNSGGVTDGGGGGGGPTCTPRICPPIDGPPPPPQPVVTPGSILVLLQQSDGTFVRSTELSNDRSPGYVILADLNGDGNIDIAEASSSSSVMVFLNQGNGAFSSPNSFALPASPGVLLGAPFTNTVAIDLAVSDPSGNEVSVLVNQGANTLSFASSANPSFATQPATLTATVHPNFPARASLSGSVIFADGPNTLGTAPVNTSGVSTLTTTFSNTGNHPLLAVFSGNSTLVGGSSANLTQVVNPAAASVSITSSGNPTVFGQPVSFTISVAGVSGASNPTGNVNLLEGNTIILSGSLDSTGKVVLTTSSLPLGNHMLVAQYSGDNNYGPANSSALTQTVNKSNAAVIVSSSINPSAFGQAVLFTVSVSASGGSGVPTGTVTLNDLGGSLGTAALDSTGVATFNRSTLSAGSHTLTAIYSGDQNFNSSNSSPLTQVVNKSDTTTSVTTSPNPSSFGQAVQITAIVTPAGNGSAVPTGSVSFSDGTNPLGSGSLANGKAVLSIATLPTGSHSITASYPGDGNFNSSTAAGIGTVTQTVSKANSVTSLVSSPNPSNFGQSVTFTVTVAGSGGTGMPTGTVTLMDGVGSIGTATLDSAGKMMLSVSSLSAGPHTITANYAGDANFNPSSATGSGAVSQVVNQSGTATTISSSLNPAVFGQAITLMANVAATGGSGIPSGTVTFNDGTNIGPATLDGSGKAAITVNSLSVGTHNITAAYQGSANYGGSTSNSLAETVTKNSVVVTLASAPNPATFGQSVTFSVQVLPAQPGGSSGTATPGGAVTLLDGTNILGTAKLDAAGFCSLTTAALTAGTHSITAVYGGDANFSEGSSNALAPAVNKIPTMTVLSSSMNPTTNVSSITLTANVTMVAGIPSGAITIFDGGQQLATAQLDSAGKAVFPITKLSIGAHNFIASYNGTSDFAASLSPTLKQGVVDSHSGVVLTSSANPQVVGGQVTFVATITPALGGQASSGTATFEDGQQILATVPVANSVASFTTTQLTSGSHQILAKYQQSSSPGSFDGASPVLLETINPAPGNKDFTLSLQSPSAILRAGESFATKLTLTPINGLTGTVSSLCFGAPIGATCTISPDRARFDGKTPISARLLITTTGHMPTATTGDPGRGREPRKEGRLAVLEFGIFPGALFGCVLLPGIKRRGTRLLALALLTMSLIGCGGNPGSTHSVSTPPGTYTIAVQSSSSSVTHSRTIQLTVR